MMEIDDDKFAQMCMQLGGKVKIDSEGQIRRMTCRKDKHNNITIQDGGGNLRISGKGELYATVGKNLR